MLQIGGADNMSPNPLHPDLIAQEEARRQRMFNGLKQHVDNLNLNGARQYINNNVGAGIDFDAYDQNGRTLCYNCVASRNPLGHNATMLGILLDGGASVDFPCRNGQQTTLLHEAVRRHDTRCVNELLARNPNLDVRNSDGLTPLRMAIYIYESASQGSEEMRETASIGQAISDVYRERAIAKQNEAIRLGAAGQAQQSLALSTEAISDMLEYKNWMLKTGQEPEMPDGMAIFGRGTRSRRNRGTCDGVDGSFPELTQLELCGLANHRKASQYNGCRAVAMETPPKHSARNMTRVIVLPDSGDDAKYMTLANKYLRKYTPAPSSIILEDPYEFR